MLRSMLFLPGNNPNLLINGNCLGADAVIFDLEDAVAPAEKTAARILVRNTMRDIVLLECIGFRPIVVHGGGKAISAELKRQDIPVGCNPEAGGTGLRQSKRLCATGIGG